MGFRFHRSVKLLPGVRLNLSKSGGSISLGTNGARVNVGPRGLRSTVGLPGSGLSYVTQTAWKAPRRANAQPEPGGFVAALSTLIARLAGR